MAKKKTIIKKPVGNGNISITIENNLKNTNPPHNIPTKRRRRQPATTDVTNSKIQDMLRGGGGGGGNLPPLKDTSYIKPPSNNFTVWRDNFNDSYNTTIPQGQAQQMGILPFPQIQAPPQPLPLTAGLSSTADTPLTMREFAMIMMQQGNNGAGNVMRPNYQNLHEDPYNEDEPMEDRYTNLRPSSRFEEIEEDVLMEAGVTEEQIKNYQKQIRQQQQSSFRTSNEQKLITAGLDPEIIETVAKIGTIKTAGTWQGKRNIKPYGDHISDPNFIASYNAGRQIWLNQQPSERKNAKNRTKKYSFLEEDEDPWNGSNNIKGEEPVEDIFYDAEDRTTEQINEDMKDMIDIRKRLVNTGLRSDPRSEAEINADLQKVIQESNSAKLLTRALKGHNARKEVRELQGKKNDQLDQEIKKVIQESNSAQLLTRALKGHNARKEVKELQEKRIDQLDQETRTKRAEIAQKKEKAGEVMTKAAQRYLATKQKKAEVKKIKQALEAEIEALQEEMKAGSRELREPSAKSKRINKALASLKDFWSEDMTQEQARQARIDARQAKRDDQKKAEDNLAVKIKALKDKRKQLEELGK